MLTFESRFCDRVLRDDAAIVFDFDVEPVIWQNTLAELQDFRETIGTEPVFRVGPDMCLQQHLFFLAGLATAVDEFSYHVTDFGYVGMSRDIIPVGQHKARKRCGMLGEKVL